MKTLVYFAIILFSCSCTTSDSSTKDIKVDSITKEGLYRNDLAADGCEWHFYFVENNIVTTLSEDEGSKTKTEILKKQASFESGFPSIKVRFTYTMTGKNRQLKCGWNKTSEVAEIQLIEVEII